MTTIQPRSQWPDANLFILIEEAGHVGGDVLSRDVIFVDLGVVFFTLGIITGETFVAAEERRGVDLFLPRI